MKRMIGMAAVLVLSAAPAFAQGESISGAVKKAWAGAKQNIAESAAQMPEADYGFKPVDSVRTFGEILAHVAGANYVFCAATTGEKAPYAEDAFEKTAKTKADITKALTESLAYCDSKYNALTDASAAEGRGSAVRDGEEPRRLSAARQHRPRERALRQPGDLLPHQGNGAAKLEEELTATQGSGIRDQGPARHITSA